MFHKGLFSPFMWIAWSLNYSLLYFLNVTYRNAFVFHFCNNPCDFEHCILEKLIIKLMLILFRQASFMKSGPSALC